MLNYFLFTFNWLKTSWYSTLLKTSLAIAIILLSLSGFGQQDTAIKSTVIVKRHPIIAGYQVIGINIGVWGMNRIAGASFADINFNSIKRNFRTGFVWDNDQFSTNMIFHPYHGGLYYNAARMNGLSFATSTAYTLGGSLMWELFMETEPPSINDVFATTLGGIAFGEITFRLANGIVDNRKRGLNRVWREALVTVISPTVGFDRLLKGDMWRRKHFKDAFYKADYPKPIIEISAGMAWLSSNKRIDKGESSAYARFNVNYGKPMDPYKMPYDYFTVQADLIVRKQLSMGDVSLLGRIWSREYTTESERKLVLGVFQHFDYISKDTSENAKKAVPVQISGAAVVGGGILTNQPAFGRKALLENALYANIVLLGGTHSDYYSVIERNYNLGSGYSVKSFNSLKWSTNSELRCNYHLMHLFTWRNKIDSLYYKTLDPHYLDVQGTPGNTQIHILQAGYGYHFSKRFAANFDMFFYHRESRYIDYAMVVSNTFRFTLGLSYKL